MTTKGVTFRAPDGSMVTILAEDTGISDGMGNQYYRLAVDSAVSIDPGTITIGAVTIKDNASSTAATVAVPTSISEASDALAVQAPILGKLADAADLAGTTTTINAKLRGLIQLLVAKIGVTIADGDDATLGITTGAAVITDANGTVQQYLRGLVKLIVAKINVKVADGDDATLGITTGAAVVTDANGTIQQYLRGLVKLFAARIPAALGQTTMSASLPVTLASDQSNVPTARAGFTVAYLPSFGIAGARFQSADQSGSAAAVTSAPTSGQKLVITEIVVSAGAIMSVDFTEETTGTHLLTLYMAANSTQVIPLDKFKLATADKRLMVQSGAAGNITVTPIYYSEA